MAGVESTKGKVASAWFRWKTISRSPFTSIRPRLVSRPAGPPLTLIVLIRSMEYLTAFASSTCPSENVRPSRSSHLNTVLELSVNSQLLAASGLGSDPPVSKLSSVW
jgi:hypothetical protein